MGRPRGYKQSPETNARTAAAMRRYWAARQPWIEASREILAAANAGDRERASALLHEYMDKATGPGEEPDPVDTH